MSHKNIIKQADFNPRIKNYILLVVAFFLLISVIGIPILIFWFLGLGQYFSKRYYEHLQCKLTENHLEFKKGVLFKVEKTIPLENIQDLTFIENPLLKYFDLRVLKIETAGHSNPRGSDMKLIGIVDALNFKAEVLDQREKIKSGNNSTTTSETTNTQTNKLLEEIRDLLTDIKNKS
ncbi:MAG TPA: PH domain-containing protein [Flavobacteriaceae bacterium]|nr:PH domain-containing protein [Flavobacteriaceae bacterium]